ncbi:uncharacterized protein JCM10292_002517 [Rhodotorula paludigena]|uniref:uncharacterized protein n=1 Tax=Rhodotorula paludigena TaxID=86838 RepID=UPI0031720CAD
MDSPDKSSYIPLSLSDTLTQPKRTYRSAASTAAPPTASTSRPRPSHVHSASSISKERSEAARREAAAFAEALGFSSSAAPAEVEATPRPVRSTGRTDAGTSAAEIAGLKAQLQDKDQELAALRRELAVLSRDKKDLVAHVERLEQGSPRKDGAALDSRQLEELEKQFEAQETLLSGYQREAERSAQALEQLRTKQRRLTDYLERTYGPSWADDLGLSDRPANALGVGASPAVRTKLVARASLAGTPTSYGTLTRSHTLGAVAIPESPVQEEQEQNSDVPPSPAEPPATSPPTSAVSPLTSLTTAPIPAALAAHLDSVQALLRSMEARLISRDIELQAAEQRARVEAERARTRTMDLEKLIEKQADATEVFA